MDPKKLDKDIKWMLAWKDRKEERRRWATSLRGMMQSFKAKVAPESVSV